MLSSSRAKPSILVTQRGFKPRTSLLKGRCSGRLSYWVRSKKFCAEYEIKSQWRKDGLDSLSNRKAITAWFLNNPPDDSQEPPLELAIAKSAQWRTAGFEPANGRRQRPMPSPLGDAPCIRLVARNSGTLKYNALHQAARHMVSYMGWVKGLEPSTLGTTIRCSNQLSYTHHINFVANGEMARQRGIRTPRPTA